MTLVVAWIVFPLVLALLSLGCGLLLEAASAMRLPGTLLLPGGFIVISLATYFAHMTDATARLQTPLVLALAIAGYAIARPWRRFQFDGWLAGAAGAVYFVFAAPVLLSGAATFAGYIRLDDTATFMSMLDRALTNGYGAAGLAPSTYKATLLNEGYKYGYPLGSMLPLDVGHTLLRVDQLWLWQPYLTFLSVLTGLGLYELVSGLVQSRWLRACVAFFGAQAALIYGYAMWGGVKELFAPSVVLFAVCLVPRVKVGTPRQVIPLAAASAAVLGGLSVGGAIWLIPMLAVGVTLLVLNRSVEDLLKSIGVYAVTVGFLSIPILYVSSRRLNSLGKFTKATQIGNLGHPLSWWQLPGIWPSGDFRGTTLSNGGFSSDPSHPTLTHLLAVLVAFAAIFAVVMAWRRGRLEVVVALATAVFACLVYVERASPWVGGKALASASPIVLGVGLAGVAVLIESRRHVEWGVVLGAVGGVALVAIAAGVLWSNAMQYHAVVLAPSARLMELEKIGSKFSGQGPALLTESEPYAARHFLRGLDAETASGLRVHVILLRHNPHCPNDTSGGACIGVSPDLDEIRLGELGPFPTLITRRTGVASRPPSNYHLAWSGRYYDVWQRTAGAPAIIAHLSLGSRFQPAGVPDCKTVMHLARLASRAHGRLATVFRPEVTVITPYGHIGDLKHFGAFGEPYSELYNTNAYTLKLPFKAPSDAIYRLWVGGSFSSLLTAKLDGQTIGQQRNQTAWPGNFLYFGKAYLTRGTHLLVIKHSGPDWRPGSAARQPFGLGPFVIARGAGADKLTVTKVKPQAAHSLCGKSLDWVEALSS
jgi:hypothetical protein